MKIVLFLLVWPMAVFANDADVTNNDCLRALKTYSFPNTNLRAPIGDAVKDALTSIGIGRFNSFGELFAPEPKDWLTSFLERKGVNVTISSVTSIDEIKSGSLYDPKNNGTAVAPVKPVVNAVRSERLFSHLNNDGEVLYSNEAANEDEDFQLIEKFVRRLIVQAGVDAEDAAYVRLILAEMVHSGRQASGLTDPPVRPTLIRMRWKQRGQGLDFDTAHIDESVQFASTLSVIGSGTEIFYRSRQNLRITAVPSYKIAHLLGGKSGRPVWHRASTKWGQRLAFLIFWE